MTFPEETSVAPHSKKTERETFFYFLRKSLNCFGCYRFIISLIFSDILLPQDAMPLFYRHLKDSPYPRKIFKNDLDFILMLSQQCWGSLLPVKQACRYSAAVFGFFRAKSDTKSINTLCPPQSSSSASDTFAGAIGHAPLHQEA